MVAPVGVGLLILTMRPMLPRGERPHRSAAACLEEEPYKECAEQPVGAHRLELTLGCGSYLECHVQGPPGERPDQPVAAEEPLRRKKTR